MAEGRDADSLEIARRYFAALERGDTDALLQILAPDIVQEEFPNRFSPSGQRRGRDELLEGLRRGKQIMASERYEIVHALAEGGRLALEIEWSGTLAVTLSEQLPAGFTMRARSAIFMELRDGKVVAQRNYDCFEPW